MITTNVYAGKDIKAGSVLIEKKITEQCKKDLKHKRSFFQKICFVIYGLPVSQIHKTPPQISFAASHKRAETTNTRKTQKDDAGKMLVK